jgi:glycosyltransferase involved in cell wall biosynthesis
MAIGLPSISTNIFGIPEAIINEETGILVEPGDANGLAEALIRIHTDRDLRERLSNSGREYVMSKFDDRVAAAVATAAYHETGRSLNNGNQEQHDE